MASEIISKYVAGSGLTVSLTSLGDEEGQASLAVIDGTPIAPQVEVFYKIATGNVPTANVLIEFYHARSDGTTRNGSLTGADQNFAANLTPKDQLQFTHAQVCKTTALTYRGSYIVDNPGPDWQVIVVNETGIAFNGTPANHSISYRYISPEVQ